MHLSSAAPGLLERLDLLTGLTSLSLAKHDAAAAALMTIGRRNRAAALEAAMSGVSLPASDDFEDWLAATSGAGVGQDGQQQTYSDLQSLRQALEAAIAQQDATAAATVAATAAAAAVQHSAHQQATAEEAVGNEDRYNGQINDEEEELDAAQDAAALDPLGPAGAIPPCVGRMVRLQQIILDGLRPDYDLLQHLQHLNRLELRVRQAAAAHI
jgi:hypothetical protein